MIAYKLLKHNAFSQFLLLTVIINILVLALDRYQESFDDSISTAYNFELCNMYFTLVYVIELWLKVTAFGLKSFISGPKFNMLDAGIVVVSVVDLVVANLFLNDSLIVSSYAITAIRATRIIRFFKIARFWKGF